MKRTIQNISGGMIAFLLVALLISSGPAAFAQSVPQGIQYQSVIRGTDGKPLLNESVSIRFKISNASGSTLFWQEDHSVTTNDYGMVNLIIGQGTKSSGTAASFGDINWAASNAKIEVLADLSGGSNYTSLGNNNLWSVPYALHAPAPDMGLGDLNDVGSTAPTNGQVLKWNGTTWEPGTDNIGTQGAFNLDDITDVDATSPTNGQVLKWNGTQWKAQTDDKGAATLDELNDVNTSGATNGYVLKWNGSTWVPQVDEGARKLEDLNNVSTTAPTSGQVLKWNGTAWAPQTDNEGAKKTTDLSDISSTAPATGQVLKWNGSAWAPAKDDTGSATGGAASIWTKTGNNTYYNTGNVGINVSSPTNRLHVVETLTSTKTEGIKFTASGSSSSTTTDFTNLYTELKMTGGNSSAIRGVSSGSNTVGVNFGLYGEASGGVANGGVYGEVTGSGNAWALRGEAEGTGTESIGVVGRALGTGTSTTNIGLYGAANNAGTNYGILATLGSGATGYAGVFAGGDVNIVNNLSKGGGSFKIDHPLDPENKFLYHSFVESPDMMNVYNGNATTGADSTVTVTLPEYFETLNRDFRYQLTVIGDFAQAIILEEVSGNKFVIKTNKPNVKVSWQVTGVRQDPYAKAHPIVTEVEKSESEKGKYLHPELYGESQEKSIFYVPIMDAEKGLAPKKQ